jgi:hypothetical protein
MNPISNSLRHMWSDSSMAIRFMLADFDGLFMAIRSAPSESALTYKTLCGCDHNLAAISNANDSHRVIRMTHLLEP